jgi:hypothetical protein
MERGQNAICKRHTVRAVVICNVPRFLALQISICSRITAKSKMPCTYFDSYSLMLFINNVAVYNKNIIRSKLVRADIFNILQKYLVN